MTNIMCALTEIVSWLVGLLVGLLGKVKVLENGSEDFSDFLHEVWDHK